MATYVQLGAAKTWYDEHGQGHPLVLLHAGWSTRGSWSRSFPRWPNTSTSTPPSGVAMATPPTSRARSPTSS
jgi:pimeloyl-ACP methyl ester carboxylesterase